MLSILNSCVTENTTIIKGNIEELNLVENKIGETGYFILLPKDYFIEHSPLGAYCNIYDIRSKGRTHGRTHGGIAFRNDSISGYSSYPQFKNEGYIMSMIFKTGTR
jgi:hypothetical protein